MKGNTVSISGNLTRDAETREFANGNMLVSFSICWNARKKEGESWVNVPNFFDCKIFCSGKQFSTFLEGLHKGEKVAIIDGHLSYESWESERGKQSKLVVIVDDIAQGFVRCGKPKTSATQNQQAYEAYEVYEDIPF